MQSVFYFFVSSWSFIPQKWSSFSHLILSWSSFHHLGCIHNVVTCGALISLVDPWVWVHCVVHELGWTLRDNLLRAHGLSWWRFEHTDTKWWAQENYTFWFCQSEAEIFQKNLVNTMADDDLATCVTRSSATTVLSAHQRFLVLQEEEFQQPEPSWCQAIYINAKCDSLCFLNMIYFTKVIHFLSSDSKLIHLVSSGLHP